MPIMHSWPKIIGHQFRVTNNFKKQKKKNRNHCQIQVKQNKEKQKYTDKKNYLLLFFFKFKKKYQHVPFYWKKNKQTTKTTTKNETKILKISINNNFLCLDLMSILILKIKNGPTPDVIGKRKLQYWGREFFLRYFC